MKKKMGIAFLVLISAISTCNIALGVTATINQADDLKKYGTVADYLQNVVEKDNELAKENSALTAKIGELQNKLNDLTNELSNVKTEISNLKDSIGFEKQSIKYTIADNRIGCPSGWMSQGRIGITMPISEGDGYDRNHLGRGGDLYVNADWRWTHPLLCKRQ